jgi:hypothetical protein
MVHGHKIICLEEIQNVRIQMYKKLRGKTSIDSLSERDSRLNGV